MVFMIRTLVLSRNIAHLLQLLALLSILLSLTINITFGAVSENISSSLSLSQGSHNHIHSTYRPLSHLDFCSPPPSIPHAQCNLLQNQRHNAFKVGEIASYSCEQGYIRVSGQEQLKCLSRDRNKPPRWESASLICEIVNCGDPGHVENAVRSTGTFNYNTVVEFKCKEGYRMIGVPFLTCKDNATWNREKPYCQLKQCQELPDLLNGRIVYSDERRVTDSKAEFICDFSFKLNTHHHIRYCRQDDTWSELDDAMPTTFPRCQQVTCPVPSRPHSGLKIINLFPRKSFKPGDIIIYSCHTGTRATAKCLPDGTWQRGPPHCPPQPNITCPMPNFEHGTIISSNGNKSFQVLYKSLTFRCEDNYKLEGAPSVTCLPNSKWSDNMPSCVFSPPPVPSSPQLTILVTSISVLLMIIFIISFILAYRWRQTQLERRRWQRYFGNYNHRQSKTNITLNTNEMKCFRPKSPNKPTVPVTDL